MPASDPGPVTVGAHLDEVLAGIEQLRPYSHTLLEATGLPLAGDIVAPRSLPVFDNSAMDGYAVRAADVAAATAQAPVELPVTDEILAGDPRPHSLQPGTAMRIMTGAPIPFGADAVVPVEATDGGARRVRITAGADVGAHVRTVGDDVAAGDVILRAGDVLGPRQLGLLAGVGIGTVEVAPRPRVVVMSTGAELVEPDRPLPAGSIYDSNSYLLTAAVRATGAVAYRVRATSDDPRQFLEALEDQLVRADVVITTGGVSKGTRDVVKAALRSEPRMRFREVAMQPGKPQGFGKVGDNNAGGTPLFALPGNPVSSYVSFEVFVAPALRKLVGREPYCRPLFRARLAEPVRSIPGRRQFLRGRFAAGPSGPEVTPVGGHGSHLLGGLGAANALIVLAEDLEGLDAGADVPVMLLDREY
ncbi:MAG TPA: gephyrin-like molybdotransferase Glp [Marmoricola sp.]